MKSTRTPSLVSPYEKTGDSRFAPNLLPYTGVRAVFFRGHVRSCEKGLCEQPPHLLAGKCALCIGYRLRWRSDIWRTDRGVAEVRSPDIRPATDDDIRHNAPGLLETVDQLLRTKVRRKLLNQDKPSRLASYALQQHKAKSARLAASEFSFLLAVLRRSRWVRAVEQA